MSLIKDLNWRYATKKMNGNAVPQEKVDSILEAIQLAPTSYGLQPFKVIVVTNQELRAKIHEQACPQPQIVDGSHVLVFAPYANVTEEHVDEYMALVAKTRNTTVDKLEGFKSSIMGTVNSRSQEQLNNWAARQAYIALGHGIIAAANEKVDATPMEGFNPDKLDEVLKLKEQNLKSAVLLTLGYRNAEEDSLASAAKVRKPKEELFEVR